MIAVGDDGNVEIDDIATLGRLVAGDAVADLMIDQVQMDFGWGE